MVVRLVFGKQGQPRFGAELTPEEADALRDYLLKVRPLKPTALSPQAKAAIAVAKAYGPGVR